MQIRRSTEADFESILAIYNQAIPTLKITADLEFATPDNRRAWFDFHLKSEKYPLWTVSDENGIVGWFSFSPFYERLAFEPTTEISIYLDEKAKGKGYGSKIIEFMQSEMANFGMKTLMAYVFDLNDVSKNLMKKHGFQEWAHFPHIANMGKDAEGKNQWRTLLILAYQQGIEE